MSDAPAEPAPAARAPPPPTPAEESTEALALLRSTGELARIQQQALQLLKDDSCLRAAVEELVRSSDALRRDAKGSKLFAGLKGELEGTVLERATARLFELLAAGEGEGGMALAVEAAAQEALARVHARRPAPPG